jgi:protein MpaA
MKFIYSLLLILWLVACSQTAGALQIPPLFAPQTEDSLPNALYPILGISMPFIKKDPLEESQKKIVQECKKIDAVYNRLGWKESPCLSLPWTYDYISEQGDALIYWDYNFSSPSLLSTNKNHPITTLILGGVHPDELTPVHMAFKLAQTIHNNGSDLYNVRIIIAPLVNPDGFFTYPPKRTNWNGVDLNRNFPTKTWPVSGYSEWYKGRNRDPRKFPGFFANSEQGTRFQSDLIEKFHPDKIISIHAPLGFLDLDFDHMHLKKKTLNDLTENQRKAQEIAKVISKSASNYKIKDFGFYPGSLGNYAGNERSIPTITLELKSSNPNFAEKFWKEFSPGIIQALKYQFNSGQTL